jgi:hypothetical protein
MTQSYEIADGEVREGSLPAEAEAPESNAETRAPARASVALPSSVALDVVTQSARAGRKALVSGAAMLDRPGSLLHSQPPTFAQAWEHHLACARHYDALLFRWPRYVWGLVHVFVIKPALNFLELVTSSPAWFLVTAAVAAVIWIWG